jgi:hypothetical protein
VIRTCSWFLLALGVTCHACASREDHPPAVASEERPSPRIALDVSALGKDRSTTLRALRMPHHYLTARLGAHRVSCTSTLATQVSGAPAQRIEQEVTLRVDATGHFVALKNTSPQFGQEVIWSGDWLYPRLRYSKFIRRKPRAEEPTEIADRFYGLLPAYVRLLGRFLSVELAGTARHNGRDAIRLTFALRAQPDVERVRGGARVWRETIAAKRIEGKALLDAKTGAPLSVELKAQLSFNPPAGPTPTSGIPSKIDGKSVGTMELSFSQRVSDIGRVTAIAAPPEAETIDNPRRVRLEYERQLLTGELPLSDATRGDLPRSEP